VRDMLQFKGYQTVETETGEEDQRPGEVRTRSGAIRRLAGQNGPRRCRPRHGGMALPPYLCQPGSPVHPFRSVMDRRLLASLLPLSKEMVHSHVRIRDLAGCCRSGSGVDEDSLA
jgi:hypothetical protein